MKNKKYPRNFSKQLFFNPLIIFLFIFALVLNGCSPEQNTEKLLENIMEGYWDPADIEEDILQLADIGEPAIQLLLDAFQDPDNTKSLHQISYALSRLWNNDVKEVIISTLEDPVSNKQLIYSAELLGNHPRSDAVEPLISAYWKFKDANDEIWFALNQIGDPRASVVALDVLENKSDFNNSSIRYAEKFLEYLGVESIPVLVEKLTNLNYAFSSVIKKDSYWNMIEFAEEDQESGYKITKKLYEIGEEAIPELAVNLTDGDQNTNALIMQLIYMIGGHTAAEAIVGVLNDNSETVVLPALDAFLWMLEDEADGSIALGMLNSNSDLFADLFKFDNKYINTGAAWALAKSTNPAAVDTLYLEIDNPNPQVRLAAISALTENKDGRALESLRYALLNDTELKMELFLDMYKTLGADPVPVLAEILQNEVSQAPLQAITAMGDFGASTAVPHLVELLSDKDITIRMAAIEALGKIGDPIAIPDLVLLIDDENEEIQKATLGKLGDAGALPALQTKFNTASEELRELILTSAGEIGGDDSVPLLLAAFGDDSFKIQRLAAEILSNYPEENLTFLFDALEVVNYVLDNIVKEGEANNDAFFILFDAVRREELQTVTKFYRYLIARGDPESEEALVWALSAHGNSSMASAYLNCGNKTLDEAARKWAKDNGYIVTSLPSFGSGGGTGWGSGN